MARRKTKDVVYIILDGMEYKVADDNGAAEMLILGTDSAMPKEQRIRYLDIRGLGVLKFRSRKIVRNRKSLEYRLKFEQSFARL